MGCFLKSWRLGLLCCAALYGVGAGPALPAEKGVPAAAHAGGAERASTRPRIGLVLSGGGARGTAHVGVLRVLEQLRVPIDAIAGTSMGAVVGGLYASGLSADQIEALIRSVNWQDAFQDRPPRAELGYRRKQDDRNFLVRYALGVNSEGFQLSKGLIQGQKLNQILRNATLPVAEIEDFSQLPIPFRALATDLETGEAVVLKSGDLVAAMRASMSAPPIFSPVEIDGRMLVDGGISDNLPIDVARAMNVDVVIAVDVSFPLYTRDQLTSPLEVTNQTFAIMIRNRTLADRQNIGSRDVLIDPVLGRMTAADFSRVPQTVYAGEQAALGVRERLTALGLDERQYALYQAARDPRSRVAPTIEFVRVDEQSTRYAKMVDAAMSDVVGEPLDPDRMRRKLSSLYALDLFESIDYGLTENQQGQKGLDFHLRRKSWGPNYVRVGLNIEDDFQGNSRYNAAARFIMTELNELGGEWLTDLQIGDNPKLYTEFYQPVSYSPRYFISPHFEFQIRNVLVRDPRNHLTEYRVRTTQGGLDFGREIQSWGELRLGLERGTGSSRVRIGEPVPTVTFDRGGFFGRFSYDKLDNVYFPRHGQQFEFQWTAERSGMGADTNLDKLQMNWLIARSLERNTLIFSTDVGSTLNNVSTPQDVFTLGGFLNLSGLTPGSLSGPHYAIARLIYYRKIGKGGTGVFDFPAYAGFSLEAGNAWKTRNDASFSNLRKDASLFLGIDTLIGPVYLGAGYDELGQTAFYLFLGRTF